jgi:hypothetical protein
MISLYSIQIQITKPKITTVQTKHPVFLSARNIELNSPPSQDHEPLISLDGLITVKVHFGERKNDAFVGALQIACIVRYVKAVGTKPFLTNTNTQYFNGRKNSGKRIKTTFSWVLFPNDQIPNNNCR